MEKTIFTAEEKKAALSAISKSLYKKGINPKTPGYKKYYEGAKKEYMEKYHPLVNVKNYNKIHDSTDLKRKGTDMKNQVQMSLTSFYEKLKANDIDIPDVIGLNMSSLLFGHSDPKKSIYQIKRKLKLKGYEFGEDEQKKGEDVDKPCNWIDEKIEEIKEKQKKSGYISHGKYYQIWRTLIRLKTQIKIAELEETLSAEEINPRIAAELEIAELLRNIEASYLVEHRDDPSLNAANWKDIADEIEKHKIEAHEYRCYLKKIF